MTERRNARSSTGRLTDGLVSSLWQLCICLTDVKADFLIKFLMRSAVYCTSVSTRDLIVLSQARRYPALMAEFDASVCLRWQTDRIPPLSPAPSVSTVLPLSSPLSFLLLLFSSCSPFTIFSSLLCPPSLHLSHRVSLQFTSLQGRC